MYPRRPVRYGTNTRTYCASNILPRYCCISYDVLQVSDHYVFVCHPVVYVRIRPLTAALTRRSTPCWSTRRCCEHRPCPRLDPPRPRQTDRPATSSSSPRTPPNTRTAPSRCTRRGTSTGGGTVHPQPGPHCSEEPCSQGELSAPSSSRPSQYRWGGRGSLVSPRREKGRATPHYETKHGLVYTLQRLQAVIAGACLCLAEPRQLQGCSAGGNARGGQYEPWY